MKESVLSVARHKYAFTWICVAWFAAFPLVPFPKVNSDPPLFAAIAPGRVWVSGLLMAAVVGCDEPQALSARRLATIPAGTAISLKIRN
jgi:hypothetical protein